MTVNSYDHLYVIVIPFTNSANASFEVSVISSYTDYDYDYDSDVGMALGITFGVIAFIGI